MLCASRLNRSKIYLMERVKEFTDVGFEGVAGTIVASRVPRSYAVFKISVMYWLWIREI